MAYQKAKIIIYRGVKETRIDSMEVCFNPEKYSIDTKKNIYTANSANGSTEANPQISGAYSQVLSFNLIFDTYEEGVSVKKYTDRLLKLIEQGKNEEPNICEFVWGEFDFIGKVYGIKQDFTLFLEDGTPVRAEMNLSIQSDTIYAEKEEKGEVVSPTMKKRISSELDWLNSESKSNSSQWKSIATHNNIDNPRKQLRG